MGTTIIGFRVDGWGFEGCVSGSCPPDVGSISLDPGLWQVDLTMHPPTGLLLRN